jgi:hypothetical protein
LRTLISFSRGYQHGRRKTRPELSYLILHDPDFRRVRHEHLVETGRRIRLKHFGTRFWYNEATGEADSIIRAAAGWGKDHRT